MAVADMRDVVRRFVPLHDLGQHPSALSRGQKDGDEAVGLGTCPRDSAAVERDAAPRVSAPGGIDPIAVDQGAAAQAWRVSATQRRMPKVQDLGRDDWGFLEWRVDGRRHRHGIDCAEHEDNRLSVVVLTVLPAAPAHVDSATILCNRSLDFDKLLVLRRSNASQTMPHVYVNKLITSCMLAKLVPDAHWVLRIQQEDGSRN